METVIDDVKITATRCRDGYDFTYTYKKCTHEERRYDYEVKYDPWKLDQVEMWRDSEDARFERIKNMLIKCNKEKYRGGLQAESKILPTIDD